MSAAASATALAVAVNALLCYKNARFLQKNASAKREREKFLKGGVRGEGNFN